MDEQETRALIERTRATIAEIQKMLDDPRAHAQRLGLSPDLYDAAHKLPVTPQVQAEVDRLVRQDLEAVESHVVAAMRNSPTGARKVVGKKTRKLI